MPTKITAKCSFDRRGVKVCYPPQNGSGGGISGLGYVNHLIRVLTVEGADGTPILTVESGDIEENSVLISGTKNGDVTGWNWNASSSDDNSSFKVSAIHSVNDLNVSYAALEYINGNAGISNFFKVDSEHCKIQSKDIPSGSVGFLTVDANGVISVSAGGGSGTVTSVSVVSANGFAGTVATSTTTPAITITTSISGLLKGDGTAISAATAADVTGQLITGYVSGAGTVAATDSILQAIQKLNGNIAAISSGVTSVSGTTNRITSTGGATPVIDISSSYVGQSSITTVGTLASGAVPASLVTAGTFGTGAYTMSTSLSTPSLIGTSGQIAHTSVAQSSGSITDYLFTPSNHTGQTASTNAPSFKIAGNTKQWATGTVATQYWNYLAANTFGFVGASTVTNSFGLFVESAAAAGTNLTAITNNYSLGTDGNVKFGSGVTGIRSSSNGSFFGWFGANVNPSFSGGSANYSMLTNGVSTYINATSSGFLILANNGTTVLTVAAGAITAAQTVALRAGTATAATSPLKFQSGTNLTTAEAGAMEYNGTNLFFTRSGTTRENVLVAVDNATAPSTSVGVAITNFYGSAATNFLGDPNRWASVNILGSVYKIPLYT